MNEDDEKILHIFTKWLSVADHVLYHYEKLVTIHPDKMAIHIVNNSLNHHREELKNAIDMIKNMQPVEISET